jgi:hypothetical protein
VTLSKFFSIKGDSFVYLWPRSIVDPPVHACGARTIPLLSFYSMKTGLLTPGRKPIFRAFVHSGNSYYREWDNDEGSRQQRWREFLMQEDPKETSIRRADWGVGDETFRAQLEGYQGRAVRHRRGRPPKSGGPTAGISS